MPAPQKAFKIPGDQIRQLISPMGSCYASDRITVDGAPVGYMYREQPQNEYDSGWHFFAGDESQDYADEAGHFGIYDVNTICNYDPAIIPLLDAPFDSAFGRVPGTDTFEREAFEPPEDAKA
jgi:hypothetical protein